MNNIRSIISLVLLFLLILAPRAIAGQEPPAKKNTPVTPPIVKHEPIAKESSSPPFQDNNEYDIKSKTADKTAIALSAINFNVTLFSIILTVLGILVGILTIAIGVVGALLAPYLAAVGALAAVLTNCTLIVEKRN